MSDKELKPSHRHECVRPYIDDCYKLGLCSCECGAQRLTHKGATWTDRTSPTFCPTCEHDGTERSPFDANCPAAWAHACLVRWATPTPPPPSETPNPMASIPFQKPLTVLLRRDGGAKQADEDLASISDGLKTVFRIDVPESYFHQLRLRIAENPDLAKQIAVSYLDENHALHSVGLAFEDELHWPIGFLDEAWNQEVAVKKAREARRANG